MDSKTCLVLTCRDECVVSQLADFINNSGGADVDALCSNALVVGGAGTGKTRCLGTIANRFPNSCWQFATRNAAEEARRYINHTGRYYLTTFQFLCIDVPFMTTINTELKNLEDKGFVKDAFGTITSLKEMIDCTKSYFVEVIKEIFERCRMRRSYMSPDVVKLIIAGMRDNKVPVTRQTIVQYLERYCVETKKSFSSIPPEIRYDIFGVDESGRVHMVFFYLMYFLYVHVNDLYHMPASKPTYVFVGSHTQGNVIWNDMTDSTFKKYSLITMHTLPWMQSVRLLIKYNTYNRRSPTRNPYTNYRNLLIKRAEEGMCLEGNDLLDLFKLHNEVYQQTFTPKDNNVQVFTATHAISTAMSAERFKLASEARTREYVSMNAEALGGGSSGGGGDDDAPRKSDCLHYPINSMMRSEKYLDQAWTSNHNALRYVKQRESMLARRAQQYQQQQQQPFDPYVAYSGDRSIKMNVPYVVLLKWKVMFNRIKGTPRQVLEDFEQLNVIDMSGDLVMATARQLSGYLDQFSLTAPGNIIDTTNPIVTYYKLTMEIKQMISQYTAESDMPEIDIILPDKLYYTLMPNAIVSVEDINNNNSCMSLKLYNTCYVTGYQLRYHRKSTLVEILSTSGSSADKEQRQRLRRQRQQQMKRKRGGGGVPADMQLDLDEIMEESVGYEADPEIIDLGDDAAENDDGSGGGKKRRKTMALTTSDIKEVKKSKVTHGQVVWYVWPIALSYAKTISVSQGSTVATRHIICFTGNTHMKMEDVIVGLTRANNPKNQRILLDEREMPRIKALDYIVIHTNRIVNEKKSIIGIL